MSTTETETTTINALPVSKLTKSQRLKFGPKHATIHGRPHIIRAEVRFDDDCGNGHNTFSITGDYKEPKQSWENASGGCCHEEIAAAFPELAPLIKWHLCSTDGPMHYPGNVLYLAGDRDCWGRRKGEIKSYSLAVKFGDFPIEWTPSTRYYADKFIKWMEQEGRKVGERQIVAVPHKGESNPAFKDQYTLSGFQTTWGGAPFDTEREAQQFLEAVKNYGFQIVRRPSAWGEGKAREFDFARSSAIWPEATDEQLSAEPEELKRVLLERLPGLMQEFKAAVESLGFTY